MIKGVNLQLFGSAASQTVHSGQTIKIKIDGQEVGRIQSGEGRRSFGQEGIYEIGSIMPKEHVPLRYEGGFTVDKFYVRKKDLAKLGIAALGEDILKMDVIDIEVLDNVTGETVRVYEGCSLNDYSETFRVNAIAGENASWVYLNAR
jgi:hypothetical protein